MHLTQTPFPSRVLVMVSKPNPKSKVEPLFSNAAQVFKEIRNDASLRVTTLEPFFVAIGAAFGWYKLVNREGKGRTTVFVPTLKLHFGQLIKGDVNPFFFRHWRLL